MTSSYQRIFSSSRALMLLTVWRWVWAVGMGRIQEMLVWNICVTLWLGTLSALIPLVGTQLQCVIPSPPAVTEHPTHTVPSPAHSGEHGPPHWLVQKIILEKSDGIEQRGILTQLIYTQILILTPMSLQMIRGKFRRKRKPFTMREFCISPVQPVPWWKYSQDKHFQPKIILFGRIGWGRRGVLSFLGIF